ncbi:SdpI family protein [Mycobacteroides franklinii]|uniref:SdpI family protein n=1 Tax=Mycobacteroides franklinii TaxID=948102 RepID=UPI0009F18013|nr:SdpI family protein [Mycobacteroides franklinii]
MNPADYINIVVSCLPSTVIAGVSLSAWRKVQTNSLPRNTTVGFRTKATLRSDEAWDKGNRAGIKVFLLCVPLAVITVAAMIVRILVFSKSSFLINGIWAVAFLCVMGYATVKANQAANSTKRDNQ